MPERTIALSFGKPEAERLQDLNSRPTISKHEVFNLTSCPPSRWLGSDGQKLRFEAWAKFGHPINFIRDGAVWRFSYEPDSVARRNHRSALDNAGVLAAELQRLEENGCIEYLGEVEDINEFVSHVNPFGAVVQVSNEKVKVRTRMVVDPSITGVNRAMAQLPLRLPTVREALGRTDGTSFLGKRDLKSGFHHVVLSESARKYMGFQHPQTGRVGRWVVLPFGAAQSPAIFCEMTRAAADIFNQQFKSRGIAAETLVYVDDFLIIARSHGDVMKAFDVMDEVGDELGLTWGPEKDVGRDIPCQALEVFGGLAERVNGGVDPAG